MVVMKQPSSSINWRSDTHALRKYQFLYHFLPHPEEKRRAKLLLVQAIFGYCVFLVVLGLTFRVVPAYLPGILGYASNINTTDLMKYTNKRREDAGLPALKMSNALSLAAQRKAEHMFAKGYWAHIAPDGTEPWDFIIGAGYNYTYAGENLAKNFGSSKDVVQAWYNSSSHRQNLLNKNYSEVGFAAVNGVLNGYQTTLVVQMFGAPRVIAVNTEKEVYQLESVSVDNPADEVKDIRVQVVQQPYVYQQINVQPVFDVSQATKIFSGLLAAFIILLLALDIWYSKKMGITKINGNTLAHIAFLVLVVLSIWFVLKPGAII